MSAEAHQEILRTEGLSKFFPGVKALDNVNFSLRRGEIMALLGENGAGKSTLIKALTGVYHADRGTIWLEGQAISPKNTAHAHLLGIEAGGGLVENQHLGRQVDGPTDSDDLLHRHRKAVQRLAHVEGKAVGGHQRRRPGLHLFTSQQTKPPRLTADEQVIRHRHIRQQVHFLVDGADPQLLGMGGPYPAER